VGATCLKDSRLYARVVVRTSNSGTGRVYSNNWLSKAAVTKEGLASTQAVGGRRPTPAGGRAGMAPGKRPFIIGHCAAPILPVLAENMIDMMEAPIKCGL
jgi:hypothetical protein